MSAWGRFTLREATIRGICVCVSLDLSALVGWLGTQQKKLLPNRGDKLCGRCPSVGPALVSRGKLIVL